VAVTTGKCSDELLPEDVLERYEAEEADDDECQNEEAAKAVAEE
jgi:hypothetical protein